MKMIGMKEKHQEIFRSSCLRVEFTFKASAIEATPESEIALTLHKHMIRNKEKG